MSYLGYGVTRTTTGFCNGPGKLTGTIDRSGVYGSYAVLLLDQTIYSIIAKTMSSIDGTFTFSSLATDRPLAVMGFDRDGEAPKNADIADRLTAE